MQNRFEQAISLMREAGYEDLAQRLRRESEAMAADSYKIAVVGEFKTCKSTLINKVFLKDDILFTDIMEATAVPTEICYSRDKYLEIAPYEKKTATKPNPFENGAEEQVEEIGEEAEPFRIYDPAPEDIEKHTSAPSTGERARLAGEISRVKLGWPSPHLAGLTIFDTPGINSINEAVIATTYGVIPESDLVLFLTTARQLSEIELEFLTGRVLSEGITRVMTVVAYDPHMGALSTQQRKKLIDAIKGQLAGIGHGDIPVEMVDIRDRPGESDDDVALRDRIDAGEARVKNGRIVVDSVIGGLLGEKAPSGGRTFERFDDDSDESIGIAALEEKLIAFIRENVRPARMEKANRVLQNQVRLAKVRCSTEIAALGKSETERKQLLDDFKSKERKIKEEQETLSAQLKDDLGQIRRQMVSEIERGLDRIAASYVEGFDRCDNMGDLQNRLNTSSPQLRKDIEKLFVETSGKIRERIEALSEKHQVKSMGLLDDWRAGIGKDLDLDGGALANVPPSAILALDFSLFVLFGPFRPLARVIVRLLANEIPFLNKILPASVAAGILRNKIKASLNQQFIQIRADMVARTCKAFDEVGDNLLRQWQSYSQEQLDSVRSGLETSVEQPSDSKRLAALSEIEKELDELVAIQGQF